MGGGRAREKEEHMNTIEPGKPVSRLADDPAEVVTRVKKHYRTPSLSSYGAVQTVTGSNKAASVIDAKFGNFSGKAMM